jgi:hypothetical protein
VHSALQRPHAQFAKDVEGKGQVQIEGKARLAGEM